MLTKQCLWYKLPREKYSSTKKFKFQYSLCGMSD